MAASNRKINLFWVRPGKKNLLSSRGRLFAEVPFSQPSHWYENGLCVTIKTMYAGVPKVSHPFRKGPVPLDVSLFSGSSGRGMGSSPWLTFYHFKVKLFSVNRFSAVRKYNGSCVLGKLLVFRFHLLGRLWEHDHQYSKQGGIKP